jgi:hypothetical protein
MYVILYVWHNNIAIMAMAVCENGMAITNGNVYGNNNSHVCM